MKHFFTLFTAIATLAFMMPAEGIAQLTYVPDDHFEQALIDLGLDSPPLDDYILTANIDTLKYLYVWEKEISDLTGIEDFISLRELYCYDNLITSLDVSNCIDIEVLNCYRNELTSLNLANCTKLEYLRCYENELTTLNVEDCASLNLIMCKNNMITSLDVSNCSVIEELACNNNALTSLITTGCSVLKYLHCFENHITTLDLSTNPALYILDSYDNDLVSLNASGCSDLDWLFCTENELTSLNLSNCSSLTWILCYDNALTTIDLSQCTALQSISCNNNLLTTLDVSMNTSLLQLICNDNALTSLNIKNGNNASMLGDEDYAGLDARSNPNLECIQVDDAAAAAGYEFWYKDATAMYSEDCGYSAVQESILAADILVYPNPASSTINLRSQVSNLQATAVEIYDLNGRKLLEKNYPAVSKSVEVDVSSLESGVYFCTMTTEQSSATKKLIIQK